MKYNNTKMLQTWNTDGFINIPSFFSKKEIDEMKTEALKLLTERDSEWVNHGLEGSRPYLNPHKESKLFDKILKNPRIVKLAETLISTDMNIPECEVEALQSWIYFKPPGELGRDIHQNIFYTHADWGTVLNISIAINDADRENGCLYYYPETHLDKVCYPIPDDLRDEERIKTNPGEWLNERGKPLFIPGTWVDGEWVEKYPKIYASNCKAGSLSVIHSHVLHGSDDNKTKDKWRMAFLVGYTKRDSYVRSGGLQRERINVYK